VSVLTTVIPLLGFALKTTAPPFLQVLIGMIAKRFGLLKEALVNRLSRWTFNTAMPLVMFLWASQVDLSGVWRSGYLLSGVLSTLVIVIAALGWARWRKFPPRHWGVFAQGAYRSNMGFIGIALCANAYGVEGLALAALPLALWTMLYNVVAVWLLSQTLGNDVSVASVATGVLRNPLILGISGGLLFAVFEIPLPSVIRSAGASFTAVFLPFVLVLVGASLSLKALQGASRETFEACFWKLLVMPLVAVAIALLLQVRGTELAIVFLLLASPTATASFVMVAAYGGNGPMAANIVVLTTLCSIVTITFGLTVLQLSGLI